MGTRWVESCTATAMALAMVPHGLAATTVQDVSVPRIAVGDGTVDGSFIESYRAAFTIHKKSTDGTVVPFGRWTDWVRGVRRYDRLVLEREVARYDSAGVEDLWRLHENALPSLAPIFTLQRMGADLRNTVKLDFVGPELTYTTTGPDGRLQSQRLQFPQPVYDLSLWAVLLVAFPLEVGYQAQFPVVGGTGQLTWETIRVTARESVAVENGEVVEAWVVSTETRPWTAWLTKEPPYIAKVIQRFPDGSEWISERR